MINRSGRFTARVPFLYQAQCLTRAAADGFVWEGAVAHEQGGAPDCDRAVCIGGPGLCRPRPGSAAAGSNNALAATHQLDAGVPLLVVRGNLRHASVQTTERHLHVESDQQQTQKHRLRPG